MLLLPLLLLLLLLLLPLLSFLLSPKFSETKFNVHFSSYSCSQHCPASELEVDSFLSDQSYSDDGAFVAAASHGTAEVAMCGSSAGAVQ